MVAHNFGFTVKPQTWRNNEYFELSLLHRKCIYKSKLKFTFLCAFSQQIRRMLVKSYSIGFSSF